MTHRFLQAAFLWLCLFICALVVIPNAGYADEITTDDDTAYEDPNQPEDPGWAWRTNDGFDPLGDAIKAGVRVGYWLVSGSAGDAYSSILRLVGAENSCVFCSFAGKFTQIVDRFAKNTFQALAAPAAEILTYLFAIWVAVMAGAVALGVGAGSSPMQFAWTLAKRFSLFFALYFLLSAQSSSTYWDWLYEAPIRISGELSDLVISTTPNIVENAGDSRGSCFTPIPSSSLLASNGSAAAIQMDTVQKFVCQIWVAETINKAGIAAALTNVRVGWVASSMTNWTPFFQAAIAALILLFIFGVAMFYYAFLIIDVFFRITFIAGLAPIFIIFFFFQPTRGWTNQVINGTIAALATLFGANIVYSVVNSLMSFLPEIALSSNDFRQAAHNANIAVGNAANMTLGEMFKHLEDAGQFLGWGSAGLWYLLMSGILAYAMSRRIGEMFSSVFGGFNPSFNMAESAVKVVQTGAQIATTVGSVGGALFMREATMNRNFAQNMGRYFGHAADPGE